MRTTLNFEAMSLSADRPQKSPRDSMSSHTLSIQPNHLNHNYTAHGGNILKAVDETAGIVARRHCHLPVVTVAIDRVEFLEPIYVSEFVTCRGRLIYVGRTSMDILVTVEAEDPDTGIKRITNRCLLTFVALDPESKRPAPVPGLLLETEEDERLYRFAEAYRKRRAEEEDLLEIALSEANFASEENELNQNDLFHTALGICVEAGHASVSLIQRRMGTTHAKAEEIIQDLLQRGFLAPSESPNQYRLAI